MHVGAQDTRLSLPLQLPVELHGIIINELEGEEDALKHCALTCKLYGNLAQRYLFRAIFLKFSPGSNPAEKFLSIISQSPHIVNYVKRLSLRGYMPAIDWAIESETQVPDDNGIVAEVLSALDNLQELQLNNLGRTTVYLPLLSPASMAMIQSKCHCILHLTLEGSIDKPWTILTQSNSLESLDMDNIHLLDIDAWHWLGPEPRYVQASVDLSLPRLKLMRLSSGGDDLGESIFSYMMKSTAQGGLESLSVNMDNASVSVPAADFQAVAGIIKNSAKSLKTLDITVSTDLPVHLVHDEAIFNVATVPFLEEISLTGAVIHSETRQNNCPINLHWLSRHLETIPISGKKFKKISLHSIIMDGTLVFEEDFDDEGLKWFENLVLNVALPQTLSLSVKFTIYANMHDTQTAETLIKKHLPGLHAQNLLEFDAKVQSDEEYLLELAEDFVRYEMSDSDSSF